jgi:hypothetical protein
MKRALLYLMLFSHIFLKCNGEVEDLNSIFKKGRYDHKVDDFEKGDRIRVSSDVSFFTDNKNKLDNVELKKDDIMVIFIAESKTNPDIYVDIERENGQWDIKKRIKPNHFNELDVTMETKNTVDTFANKLKSYLPDKVTLAETDELKIDELQITQAEVDKIYGTYVKSTTEGTVMPFYEKEGDSSIKIEGSSILFHCQVQRYQLRKLFHYLP